MVVQYLSVRGGNVMFLPETWMNTMLCVSGTFSDTNKPLNDVFKDNTGKTYSAENGVTTK
ncbi:MAG: hypothetical protein R3D00_05545 [Bacteroidia bacterium]